MSELFQYIIRYKAQALDKIMFYLSLFCTAIILLHIGFVRDLFWANMLGQSAIILFYGLFSLEFIRLFASVFVLKKINVTHFSSVFLSAYMLFVIFVRHVGWSGEVDFTRDEWAFLGVALVFLTQLSKNSLFLDKLYFNPTILFVISFLALILLGTVLLMLPRTSIGAPLAFIDAFFMSTSAVCITGLQVTNIATQFSFFGQFVILLLIQIGGLGIMTFTGFFGYFFSGGFSFKNQLMFGEVLGESKLNEVIKTLLMIIFITFLLEAIGAFMLFFSIDAAQIPDVGYRIFFAAFHAVSGFCNSGFTLMEGGMAGNVFRFNYPFQLALSSMFICGTLGFGVIHNFYTYGKKTVTAYIDRFIRRRRVVHKAHNFSFAHKFVVYCNIIVIALATISFFALEYQRSLAADESIWGKMTTAFFMANSARTAGFETIGVSLLSMPTLIMSVTLMWIGSSPGSTGGGVKVTTIAVALLNVVSLARGKESIEIFGRRILPESVSKAFAIILLSILSILLCFIFLNVTDGDLDTTALLFESISAYTTSGLSLGITAELSSAGKLVLMTTMFVGRVGMLTLLVAFIKDSSKKNYIYPSEKLLF
ncbi:TrkH family potassium uptake protein [Sphingobacterium corticibacter]|uniref:ATPase n=1 Tax=Sphingobacterium corticibacter TaxID=2171749 RepID=A0A2T8HKH2_9SPHI|nr:potassium transporter TrkG [Sphingobacterium corticibacter]PVH25880.1 ATPase [Sphingobacterium corticibacter]